MGAGPPPKVSLQISEYVVPTKVGDRTAMVITPRSHVRVDPSSVESEGKMTALDETLLREAQARSPRITFCVFRGRSDEDDGSWRFADGMTQAQDRDLAARLLPGQMICYRGLLRAGVSLFVHADWGERETDAYRWAVDHRIAELRDEVHPGETTGTSAGAIDLWILRNLTFFFTLSFAKLIETILPDKLALMETRMERIRRLVGLLPP